MKSSSLIVFLGLIGVSIFGFCGDCDHHLTLATTSFAIAIVVLVYMLVIDYKSTFPSKTKSPEDQQKANLDKVIEKLQQDVDSLKEQKDALLAEVSRADELIKVNIQLLGRIDKALRDKKL